MVDTYAARRKLKRIHSDLRNKGLNPLEALGVIGERLQEIAVNEDELGLLEDGDAADLVGIVYQEVLAAEARNGLGQYLTPLPVADLLAIIVTQLSAGEEILDPFCGVGLLLDRVGFLAPEASLTGIEINSPVARMAMSLGALSGRGISVIEGDAFALSEGGGVPSADVVVANPPFGAVVSECSTRSASLPDWLREMGQVPAELFGLHVCVDALRDGGILGIVLPQSVLTNNSWSDMRAEVFSRLELLAVVSLAEETFAPFKGVANACVIVGRRGNGNKEQAAPYFVSTSAGYSATGRPSGESDLPEIAKLIVLGEPSERTATLGADGSFRISSIRKTGSKDVRLGDIAELFTGKNPPLGEYRMEGPWLLKVGDLSGSMLGWRSRSKNRVSQEWFTKHERIRLRSGDICLTAAGHRPKYIGLKVDLVDCVPPEGAAPSGEVMVVRPKHESGMMAERLCFFLRSRIGYESIQELVRGSSGHLYPRDLAELVVPPLEEMISEEAVVLHRRAVEKFRQYRDLEDQASALLEEGARRDNAP